MKRFSVLTTVCLFILINIGSAQNCGTYNISDYTKMEMYFAKTNNPFTIRTTNGYSELLTKLKSGQEVKLYYTCRNDSMFISRNDLYVDEKTGLIMVFGLQAFPLKLNVGDKLDPYRDFLIQNPITKEDFNLVSTAKSDYFISGNSSFIMSTIKTYNIQSKTEIKMSTEYLNYVNAKVVAEETISIGTKNFTAYKIEHEQWIKQNIDLNINYNTDGIKSNDESAQIAKQAEKTNKLLEKKLSKLSKSMGNKDGYTVSPKTDWYVPGLGIVKTIFYNEGRMFEKDKAYVVSLN